ncbi:hypothetical protein AMECASPLE_013238 [Ameca splendens]|uniref:Uncharacterized protein n=1 Tax=Ameca splendens TaxID=208324 RepID=A0ABV0XEE3_9TELE
MGLRTNILFCLSRRDLWTSYLYLLFPSMRVARTHCLHRLCLSGCTTLQDPSSFCTALQSSTVVLNLPCSTTGFFVAILRTAWSVAASGPVVLLDSGSRWGILPAVCLSSVSARDNLRAARLNSGFRTGRPLGRPPELCFVSGSGFVRVVVCFWPCFG